MFTRHPLHPMLVHFPVALWPASLLWDAVGWWQGEALWGQMAYWSLALGCAMAALAAVAGFADYMRLVPPGRSLATATAHMFVMLTATTAFVASLIVRSVAGATVPPSLIAFGLSVAGFGFLVAGGWLGGALVYRDGVGRAPA